MRTVSAGAIRDAVALLCVRANRELPDDVRAALEAAYAAEPWPAAKRSLKLLLDNMALAREKELPVCQDTGLACVFLELGQEVHIDGDLDAAVQAGIREGYARGYLRCSVVGDPLRRVNTGDNTPGVLTVHLVSGDGCRITVLPKGFGSENMSCLKMMTPAASREDIIVYIVDSVRRAGSNPCPPMVLGVGIGGDFESCALLAKKALCRPVSQSHPDAFYAQMERDILEQVNRLPIGPQGFGGKTTALSVAIETAPTHIAGLPVALNVGCHVTRHAEAIL